jgi:O-antigen/teichoic acid export membrane protein|tara:strand:+ start:2380 stop:3606 length:1227 start_codon:yes stop_codon:yes gene_type:complete
MVSKLIKSVYKLCGVIDVGTVSAANFLISFFIIRELGTKDYALYMNLFSILMLASTLQNAFFNTTLSVKYSKIDDSREKETKAQSLCLLANLVHLFFVLPCIYFIGKVDAVFVFCVYLSFVLYLSREVYRVYNYVFNLRGIIIFSAMSSLIFTAIGLLLLLFFDIEGLTLTNVYAVTIFSGLISLFALLKSIKFKLPSLMDIKVSISDVISVGKWSSIGSLSTWAQNNSYTYLATLVIGLEATASLALARLIIMPINLVASGIYMAEKPKWAKLYKENKNNLKKLSNRTSKIMFGFISVYAVVSILLLNYIEYFLKADVKVELLLCWLAACIIQAFKFANSNILNVAEEFKYLAFIGVIISSIGVVASVLLGYTFGAIGIVFGYVIGELLHLLCTNFKIHRGGIFNEN